jgi:hypothetical protein
MRDHRGAATVADMGFLQKAVKAAATAKNQIDDVRDLRAQASVRPVAATALTDHEEDMLERVRDLGGPDPRLLLLQPEASEAAGTVLGGPHLTYSDDMIGLRFQASGNGGRHWRASVSAFHAIDDDTPFDAAAHWFGFVADHVADDGVIVPGLGDAAIQRESDLFVLADPLLLMVEVSRPDGHDDAQRMQGLARTVLRRLELA